MHPAQAPLAQMGGQSVAQGDPTQWAHTRLVPVTPTLPAAVGVSGPGCDPGWMGSWEHFLPRTTCPPASLSVEEKTKSPCAVLGTAARPSRAWQGVHGQTSQCPGSARPLGGLAGAAHAPSWPWGQAAASASAPAEGLRWALSGSGFVRGSGLFGCQNLSRQPSRMAERSFSPYLVEV